jgi:uncharacterized membrane protein YgcG
VSLRCLRAVLLALVWLGVAMGAALAQTASVPVLSARITDVTGTLDAAAVARIEAPLAALEASKGSQIAVLIVASTAPESIEAYAVRAFEQWKLGRAGVDDGVLLVVAKDDRTVRIEVGYGLEGAIPDVAAYRVIQEYLVPRFREGDFAGGIEAAVGVLAKLVEGEALPAPMSPAAATAAPAADRYQNVTGYDHHAEDKWISMLPIVLVAFVFVRTVLEVMVKAWWRRGLVGGLVLAAAAGGFWLAGLFPSLPWSIGLGFVVGFAFAAVKTGASGGGGGYASSGSYRSSSGSRSSGSSYSGGGGRFRRRWRVGELVMRWLRHLFARSAASRFPPASLQRIAAAIAAGEQRHTGQVVFAVEPALRLAALRRGRDARHRAEQLFARLRVWDTQHNNGVLIYLLLADHRIEVVADRAASGPGVRSCAGRACASTSRSGCRRGRSKRRESRR